MAGKLPQGMTPQMALPRWKRQPQKQPQRRRGEAHRTKSKRTRGEGDEPPRDYHMCKKRYEDVWDISRVLHSLCAWWASGILCECVPAPPPPPHLPASWQIGLRWPQV